MKVSKIKVELDLCKCTLHKIEKLKDRLKLENNAEVILYATALLVQMVESLNDGHQVKVKSSKIKLPSGRVAIFKV